MLETTRTKVFWVGADSRQPVYGVWWDSWNMGPPQTNPRIYTTQTHSTLQKVHSMTLLATNYTRNPPTRSKNIHGGRPWWRPLRKLRDRKSCPSGSQHQIDTTVGRAASNWRPTLNHVRTTQRQPSSQSSSPNPPRAVPALQNVPNQSQHIVIGLETGSGNNASPDMEYGSLTEHD